MTASRRESSLKKKTGLWIKRIGCLGLVGAIILALVVVIVALVVRKGARISDPNESLHDAVIHLLEASSVHITVHLETTAEGETLTVDTDGDLVQRTPGFYSYAYQTKTRSMSGGSPQETASELRFLDEALYTRFETLPSSFTHLSSLRGLWLRIPVDPRTIQPIPREELLSVLRERKLFSDVKRGSDERRNGKDLTHIQAKISPEGVTQVIELMAHNAGTTLAPDVLSGMKDNLSQSGNISLDALVDSNRILHSFSMTLFLGAASPSRLSVEFRDHGKFVQLTIPAGARDLTGVDDLASLVFPSPSPLPSPAAP